MNIVGAATTAQSNDDRVDRILERELFGARSMVGALVVLALLCFFGFGLQAIDDAVRSSSTFTVGEPQAVSDTVSFTAAGGWIPDAELTNYGNAVVATKNGWDFKIALGLQLQPGQSVEDFATIFHDIPPEDPGAEVTDLATFTTTSGLHGVTWEVHGTTTVLFTFQIVLGSEITQILASGPPETLDSVHDEIIAMATSVTMGASS